VDIFIKIMTDFGPWVCLCAALLWGIKWLVTQQHAAAKELAETQAKANREMVRRLQDTEDWIRHTLVVALGDVTKVMGELLQSSRENRRAQQSVVDAIRSKPCMHDVPFPDAQPPTEPLIRRNRDHA
jgi:hypothetical protein